MAFELPPLPYAADALEPFMSSQTLHLHHGKHHQTYVTNLNNLTKDSPLAALSLEEVVKTVAGKPDQIGIFNNAGQVYNHNLFWKSLRKGGGGAIPGALEKKIVEDFGSVAAFKEAFQQAGLTQFGSGWAWLVLDNGKLAIEKTGNADTPLVRGKTPITVVDVWEHAYYVDYQNRRADFLKAYMDNLIDWEAAAERFAAAI
ncbi:MAG: superoxide dismutase [Rhodospirillaceae bacterium]